MRTLVFGITKALWHPTTQTLLTHGHPRGREIRLDNALRGLAIPLHEGATRYYRDVGMLRRLADERPPRARRSAPTEATAGPQPLTE